MKISFFSALFVILSFSNVFAEGSTLSIKEPWVRLAPPAAKVNAAYFRLHNSGKEERALIKAESALYDKVELHLSKIDGGVAVMEKLAQVSIPAGKMVDFKPGGLHIMLIGPRSKKAHSEGDIVPLTLTFANGESLKVKAKVKKFLGASKEHRGSH